METGVLNPYSSEALPQIREWNHESIQMFANEECFTKNEELIDRVAAVALGTIRDAKLQNERLPELGGDSETMTYFEQVGNEEWERFKKA